MKSESEINWDSLTDKLLASLETSRIAQQKMVSEVNADAARQQRERSKPKVDKTVGAKRSKEPKSLSPVSNSKGSLKSKKVKH